MKYPLIGILLLSALAVASEVDVGTLEIVNGTLVSLDLGPTPYGGINGSIRLLLGSNEWYPESIWLLPEGRSISEFNYTGKTYRVPSNLSMTNNCLSSIYETSGMRAFKTSVKEGGKFCILAEGGKYKIMAEY